MNDPLQISAKTLGQLVMPTFCERCFWIRLHCKKLPFMFMPGIFSSIDSYSKKVTAAHVARHGVLPPWFKSLNAVNGTLVAVPHWSKFKVLDKETGICLCGTPDEIVRKPNAKLCICDYKTARHTDRADELLPLYTIQLSVYGYIAKHTKLGDADSLALLYYEPVTTIEATDVKTLVSTNDFAMKFAPSIVPVPDKSHQIRILLRRARTIFDKKDCPAAHADCPDCKALDALIGTVTVGVAA